MSGFILMLQAAMADPTFWPTIYWIICIAGKLVEIIRCKSCCKKCKEKGKHR